MATITSLGFNITSDWDGDGVSRARNDIAALETQMRRVSGAALHIDVVVDSAQAKAELETMRDQTIAVNIMFAIDGASELRAEARIYDLVRDRNVNIGFDLDQSSYAAMEAQLNVISGMIDDVNIRFDLNEASYATALARIDFLARDRTVEIRFDADGTDRELAQMTQEINNIENNVESMGQRSGRVMRMVKLLVAAATASLGLMSGAVVSIGAAFSMLPSMIGIGLGGFLLSKTEEGGAALDAFKEKIKTIGQEAAKPMLQPMIEGMTRVTEWAERSKPMFEEFFRASGTMINPLVDSITGFVDNLMPGFNAAVRNSEGLLLGFGQGLSNFGTSMSNMFAIMSTKSEDFGMTWNILFTYLGRIMEDFGRSSADMVADVNQYMGDGLSSVEGFFEGLLDGLDGFSAELAKVDGGLDVFRKLGDMLRQILPAFGEFYAAFSQSFKPVLDGFATGGGAVVRDFFIMLATIARELAPLFQSVGETLRQMGESGSNAFIQLLPWVTAVSQALTAALIPILQTLNNLMNDHQEVVTFLIGMYMAYRTTMLLVNVVMGIWSGLVAFSTSTIMVHIATGAAWVAAWIIYYGQVLAQATVFFGWLAGQYILVGVRAAASWVAATAASVAHFAAEMVRAAAFFAWLTGQYIALGAKMAAPYVVMAAGAVAQFAIASAAAIGHFTILLAQGALAIARITALVAIFVVYQTGIGLVAVATGAWTAAQWLLNTALLANPIGAIVIVVTALTAGIVYLVTQTEVGAEVWRQFLQGFKDAYNVLDSVGAAINNFISDVVAWFGDLFDRIKDKLAPGELAKWIIEGIWEGFKKLGGWFKDKLGDWVEDHIPGVFRKLLGINSPSTVTEEIGVNTAQGFVVGMDGQAAEVKGSAQGLVDQVKTVNVPEIDTKNILAKFQEDVLDSKAALGGLSSAMDEHYGKTNAVSDAWQHSNQVIRDTPAALAESRGAFILHDGQIDLSTEAGSKLYDTVKDIQVAYGEAASAAFTSAKERGLSDLTAAQEAEAAAGRVRQAFIDQMVAAGFPLPEVQKLIEQYALTGGDITKFFYADTSQATDEMLRFKTGLESMTIWIKTQLSPTSGPTAPVAANNAPPLGLNQNPAGRADGGLITGPGSGTSDSILGIGSNGVPTAMVSNGEFVVNAAATKQHMALLEQINSGKLSGGLAEGGALAAAPDTGGIDKAAADLTAKFNEFLNGLQVAADTANAKFLTSWTTFWTSVGTAAETQWTTTLGAWNTYLTGTESALTATSSAVQGNWTTLWANVNTTASNSWNDMRQKFDAFSAAINTSTTNLSSFMVTSWNSMSSQTTTIWNTLWDTTVSKANTSVDTMTGKFTSFESSIIATFQRVNEQVNTIWTGITEIFRTPVNGVIRIWNGVSGAFGLTPLVEMATGGAVDFASGGSVRGKGTGTSDDIDAKLSNGEHVWTAREVEAAGGHGAVSKMRNDVLHLASGGPALEWMVGQQQKVAPALQLTSGVRNEPGSYHHTGQAGDFSNAGTEGSPEMKAFAQWIFETWGRQTLELIHSPFGHNVGDGRDVGDGMGSYYGAGTMSDHLDHVHWAVPHALNDDAMGAAIPGGGGRSGPSQAQIDQINKAKAEIQAIIDQTNATRNPTLGGLRVFSQAGDVHASGTERVGGGAMGKLDAALASMTSGAGGDIGGVIPEGERLALINEALRITNTPPPSTIEAWQRGMNTLVERESGWNAGARNDWDSNAAAGNNSVGLAQVIPTTFDAHKAAGYDNIYGAVDNLAASINYIKSRYGTIENVQQANANMSPKGYAAGTNSAQAGWNLVGENGPEMVQFKGGEKVKTFDEIISQLKSAASGEGKALISKVSADFDMFTKRLAEEVKSGNQDMSSIFREELRKLVENVVKSGNDSGNKLAVTIEDAIERVLREAGIQVNLPLQLPTGGDPQAFVNDVVRQIESAVRQGVGAHN